MSNSKLLLPFCALIFISFNGFSQEYTLSGVVKDSSQTIAYANVILTDGNGEMVTGTITEESGYFNLMAKRGSYILTISFLGYKTKEQNLVLEKDADLGTVVLELDNTQLNEVVVTATKPLIEQKVDRLVFNVENSIAATGGDAVDVLKATPMVRVQDEGISIVGKGEILVMIDNRLQRLPANDLVNLLKSIPSDNIKSIEVITTPPAKYEAEGNAGLINIKLKSALPDSWNLNFGGAYTQKTYAGGNGHLAFRYNHDALSLNISTRMGRQTYLTEKNSKIFYTDEIWDRNVVNKSRNDFLSISVGADYKIKENWTTGIKYLGSFTKEESNNNPLIARKNYGNEQPHAYVASMVTANEDPKMNSLNWFNTFKLDSLGKNITVNFDYFRYQKEDYNDYSGNELDSEESIIPDTYFASTNSNNNEINNYSGKIDVEIPLNDVSLSFGGRFSYTNTNNNLSVYDNTVEPPTLDMTQSNEFNYKEHNEALYVSLSKELSEKWEMQAGLRAEATQTKGFSKNLNETNKNDYIKLFPTVYVLYSPSEKRSYSLTYSRRIRRPIFDYLNPFIVRSNPYNYYQGNPFLKPSFIDNLNLSYNSQSFGSSVYYSLVSDFAQSLSIIDPETNITRNTPLNYANSGYVGASVYYNFRKLSWWNSSTGLNFNYQKTNSKVDYIETIDGTNGYFYSNNTFTLNENKTAFIGLNYGFQLPGRNQIFYISSTHSLDLSLKFLFLDKKLIVNVLGEDLLNGQRPKISYASNGVETEYRSYGDTRGFRLSVTYNLGNTNLKTTERPLGNEEERNRAN